MISGKIIKDEGRLIFPSVAQEEFASETGGGSCDRTPPSSRASFRRRNRLEARRSPCPSRPEAESKITHDWGGLFAFSNARISESPKHSLSLAAWIGRWMGCPQSGCYRKLSLLRSIGNSGAQDSEIMTRMPNLETKIGPSCEGNNDRECVSPQLWALPFRCRLWERSWLVQSAVGVEGDGKELEGPHEDATVGSEINTVDNRCESTCRSCIWSAIALAQD
ncbi:uncharacterized protein BJX67DRAFT_108036 [Aspergillus lucknowensis]|uniref:Uncharacterized protein n=1 Tax=Aspergillus lucknowensis TaxID=176173 RepID=A0ABR4LV50_9EURO